MFSADDFDYEEAVKRFFKDDLENSIQDDGISDINLSVETKKPIPDGAYVPEEWSGGNDITSDELWKWLDLLDPDKGGDILNDVPRQLRSELSDSGREVPLGSMVFTVDFSEMGKPEFRGAHLTKDNRLAIDYKVDNVRIATPHTGRGRFAEGIGGLLKKLRKQLGS